MKNARFLLILAMAFCTFVPEAQAAFTRPAEVQLFRSGELVYSKALLSERGATVGSLLFTDLGTDDIDELVLGTGTGMNPKVSVFRADGSKLFQFTPFTPDVRSGITLASGNLEGTGARTLIVGQQFPGKPLVSLYSNTGKFLKQFAAFSDARIFGISLASGDVDGDGKDEIITSEGPLGGREVRIYRGDGSLFRSFSAFSANEEGAGITLATLDVNGDGVVEIITGQASQGSRVQIWDMQSIGAPLYDWKAFDSAMVGGIQLSTDMSTGSPTLLVSTAGSQQPNVRRFDPRGNLLSEQRVLEPSFQGGVFTTTGYDASGNALLAVAPSMPVYVSTSVPGKSISVDRAEQRLYAWEDGYLMRSYLISTGLRATPTPAGSFSVLKKVEYVNYTRIYGQDDPRNYSFPNTRWNLMFKPKYYIHTAYWHNNFGQPMSHGCVNTFLEDAKWTYLWANEGIPVNIQ